MAKQNDLNQGWENLSGVSFRPSDLTGYAFTCDPGLCKNCPEMCCQRYEISVTKKEAARIYDWLPAIAEYVPELCEGGEFVDPFSDDGEELFIEKREESDACVFCFSAPGGGLYCGIHAAALAAGEDPYRIKPRPCSLWPLMLYEGKDGKAVALDTGHDLPCLKKRKSGKPDAELLDSLAVMVNRKKLDELLSNF